MQPKQELEPFTFANFDDATVNFVLQNILKKAIFLDQKNSLQYLDGYIKSQLKKEHDHLKNIWDFATYLMLSKHILNQILKIAAEKYTSLEFLKNEYKPGYFNTFGGQEFLLNTIKQKICEKFPKEYTHFKNIQEASDSSIFGINCLALSNDNQILVSGSNYSFKIQIWKLQQDGNYQILQAIDTSNPIKSVILSNDMQMLVCGVGSLIKIYKRQPDGQFQELPENKQEHNDTISSLALSDDKQTLVSGAHDGAIKIWQLQSNGTYINTQTIAQIGWINNIALSKDKQMLIYTVGDTIKILQQKNGTYVEDTEGTIPLGKANLLALSPDKQILVCSSSLSHSINTWRLQTNGKYSLLQENLKAYASSFTSHYNFEPHTLIVTSHYDPEPYTSAILSLALSKDMQILVFGSGDGSINMCEQQEDGIYKINDHSVQTHASPDALAISNDKQTLICGTSNGMIQILHLQNDINNFNFDQTMLFWAEKLGFKDFLMKKFPEEIKQIEALRQKQKASISTTTTSSTTSSGNKK
jgi:WD40 repeat protein